ncbi:hypothetical protein P4K96_28795 [Bacillus cereus]|nr:hypothetical protein [Bacillus cereus]
MNKKIFALLLSISLIAAVFPSTSSADSHANSTFTTTPDSDEIERQKQYQLAPPTAWESDLQGNIKPAPYIVPNRNSRTNGITPMSWNDSNYTYVFDGYVLKDYKKDPKRFFISRVSVENRSSGNLPLKYTQQQSVESSWSVSANIEGEAEFGVKFLSSLKLKLGGSYSRSKTTQASSTIEAGPKNIPPQTSASYTKYRAGAYGSGQAAWKKYVKGSSSWVGMYHTGESGWAVDENDTTIVYEERKL